MDDFDSASETKLRELARGGTSVLITGGAGYLGSVLVEMLVEHGFHVTVIDNLMYGQNSLFDQFHRGNLDFIYGDVTNKNMFKKVLQEGDYEYIFPLAAIVGFPVSEQKPETTWSVNHEAILTLLENRKRGQKIIFPTTNSGYGTTTGEIECTEESPLNPISTYGRAKVAAEKAISGTTDFICYRLATMFGFSQRMRTDPLVNNFVYRAATDGYIALFERKFKRNFLHVRDGARAFLWGMLNWERMKNNIYNLGHPDYNITKEELALHIKRYVPEFQILYTEAGSDPDKRNYILSNEKILKTGFKIMYSLDDGIKELLKGYQAFRDYRFKNY